MKNDSRTKLRTKKSTSSESLKEYENKRDFSKTSEPISEFETEIAKSEKSMYVVQKHNATRLHFDFRIEYNGVLKSWAVPKGLSSNPDDKRLAIMVEDHPLEYAKFQGNIPEGEYGAGTVEIWDKGNYVNITIKDNKVEELSKAIAKGHFTIFLKGDKLNGTYGFTRIDTKNWLIVKKKEPEKRYDGQIILNNEKIVITNPEKQIDKNISKYELVKYYQEIAPLMLPHIRGRLISMLRFPNGVNGKKFFQKNTPEYFPKFLPTKCIKDSKGETCYVTLENEAGIVYLANQVVEMHTMINESDNLPDKMLFDFDPTNTSDKDLKKLKDAARQFGNFLEKIGFHPFIMTSGGIGYHIAVPIKQELENKDVRDFALKIADVIVKRNDDLTLELLKSKRQGKIFVDINRNSESQTAISPYGARARPNLPVACPFEWDELINIDPQTFSIKNYPKTDAWKDFYNNKVSIKDVIKKLKS